MADILMAYVQVTEDVITADHHITAVVVTTVAVAAVATEVTVIVTVEVCNNCRQLKSSLLFFL